MFCLAQRKTHDKGSINSYSYGALVIRALLIGSLLMGALLIGTLSIGALLWGLRNKSRTVLQSRKFRLVQFSDSKSTWGLSYDKSEMLQVSAAGETPTLDRLTFGSSWWGD